MGGIREKGEEDELISREEAKRNVQESRRRWKLNYSEEI